MVIYLGKKSIISGKNDSQNKRLATRIVILRFHIISMASKDIE